MPKRKTSKRKKEALAKKPVRNRARLFLLCTFAIVLVLFAARMLWQDSLKLYLVEGEIHQLFQQYDNQAAIELAEQHLVKYPDSEMLLLALCRGYRREGDLARAIEYLTRAEKSSVGSQRLELESKLLKIHSGLLRDFEEQMSTMVEQADYYGQDVLLAFASGFLANQRTASAQHLIDIWMKLFPDDSQAHICQAQLYQLLQESDKEILHYREGLQLSPFRLGIRMTLVDRLLFLNDFDAASQELSECRRQAPDDVNVLFLQARLLMEKQEYGQAISELDQVLLRAPQYARALILRGKCHLELNNVDLALQDLRLAHQLDSLSISGCEALGRALQAKGDLLAAELQFQFVGEASRARTEIKRLLREAVKHPRDTESRFRIAELTSQFVSVDQGAQWMRIVLDLDPDHLGAHAALATYFDQLGNSTQASFHRSYLNRPSK